MRLHHIALRVSDLERSARFYRELLGLDELPRPATGARSRSIWLALGDAILMLEEALAGTGPDAGSGHLLALKVSDLEAWEARLTAAGVGLDGRSRWTLYCRDPDGHRVGLSSHPGAASATPTSASGPRPGLEPGPR